MPEANRWPAFFAEVPSITLHDPLAQLLGTVEGGVIEYHYADAVALAGHSCPTVASAYWLTVCALRSLYPATLPGRGGIRVQLREAAYEGSAGVVASVISLLTGAAAITGFKGLAGQHARAGLLEFQADIDAPICFTRLDTGEAVYAQAHTQAVAPHPDCRPLLHQCLDGRASAVEQARFGSLWQERVRALLLDYADDQTVFEIRPVLRPDTFEMPA